MAHKKAGGTTHNARDSVAKRLGVKLFGGEKVRAGGIIIRQKGTKVLPGLNVKLGNDYTIFALKDGFIKFTEKRVLKYDGRRFRKTIANVVTEK